MSSGPWGKRRSGPGDMETPKGTDRSAGSVSADASTCDSVFQLTPVRLLRRRCKHLRRRWRSAPAPSGKTYDIRRASPSPIGLSTSFGLGVAISGSPSTNRPHMVRRGCGRSHSPTRGSALCAGCKRRAAKAPGPAGSLQPVQRPGRPGRSLASGATSEPSIGGKCSCCHGVQTATWPGRATETVRGSQPARRPPGTRKCPKEPPVRFGATGASTCVARAPVFRPLRARPTVTAAWERRLPGYPRVWRSEGPIRAPCPPPIHHGPRADAIRWSRWRSGRCRSRRRLRPRCGHGATLARTVRR